MGPWEFAVWVLFTLGAVIVMAWRSVRRANRRLQHEAIAKEDEWLEEVRRSSKPPTESLHPLEVHVMQAQLELDKRKEALRRYNSDCVTSQSSNPPRDFIPPPPPEVWEALKIPLPPAIPPPPDSILKPKK